MFRRALGTAIASLALVAGTASAQDAKAVLAAAEKALGSANLKSIQYSGTGFSTNLGQSVNPNAPWPKFDVTAYTRTINYVDGSSKEELTRVQGNNPPKGGGAPIVGEQKQNAQVSGNYAWAMGGGTPPVANAQFGDVLNERRLQIWLTPQGFVQLAKRGNGCAVNFDCEAKVSKKTEGGKQVNVITAGFGKYSISATLNDENLITKIETKFPNPVLGDMPIVYTYSDYKDYNGVKFPGKITETQGPHPFFELNVTDVKPNEKAELAVPDAVKTAEAPRANVSVQLMGDGIWYLTGGTHHSMVVEFKDYIAVVEAPLNEERSKAVMAEAKRLVVNKPIKYIINTHQHFDHSGGLRTYVAAGATVITSAMNKPYYDQTFKMKATLSPDDQSKANKLPVYIPVTDKYVLTDGTQKLELYAMQKDEHNEGMLLVYLPTAKVLVEADEFNPPAVAGAPLPTNPPASALNLYDNIQRLKLDVNWLAPIHGRAFAMADFKKFLKK
jgi:glyoxylase-like metal-dependent hydrolase (beta-lactamase superfamily II)